MKIAITGKMCSGKSFMANMIMQLDNSYNIYSYGQKIKDIAVDLFNMKNKNRSLIISIADDMKKKDPDVWANYIMKQIQYKNNIIIDDLRFQNELDLLSNEWIIIRLNISNIEHLSEKNELTFGGKYRIVDIDTEKETYEQIRLKLFLLLTKR